VAADASPRQATRHNGINALTHAAEFALQSSPADRTFEAVEQIDERQQVRYPQHAPPVRERDERVGAAASVHPVGNDR